MVAKRKPAKGKNKGHVNISIVIIIVILVAILSYAVSYLFIHDVSNDEEVVSTQRNQTNTEQTSKGTTSIITLMEGSWYSTFDGSILTISASSFKLEFPGVDGSKIINGSVIINGNEVIFTNDKKAKTCAGTPGKYSWEVKDRDKLSFKKINDPCPTRSERMAAGWEKL
jgi:uncharacterized protein YpmB